MFVRPMPVYTWDMLPFPSFQELTCVSAWPDQSSARMLQRLHLGSCTVTPCTPSPCCRPSGVLQANDVGDVKQYQEAAALQLLLAEPALAQPFLLPRLMRYDTKA
jgi:hypothetical protein